MIDKKNNRKNKILVTGALGFIGSHVCTHLLDKGYAVVGVGKEKTKSLDKLKAYPKFEFIENSLKNIDSIMKMAEGVDVIMHLAAQSVRVDSNMNPINDFEQNALVTMRILEVCRKKNIRLIFASSIAVYSGKTTPYKENEACPDNFLGLSKYVSDQYCELYHKKFGLEFTSLRFSYVYGPGNFRGVNYDIVEDFKKGNKIKLYMNPNNVLDFIHVSDVARAFVQSLEHPVTGIFNISSAEGHKVKSLIEETAKLCGRENYELVISSDANKKPVHTVLDNTKAKKQMGWSPQENLLESMKEMINND